VKCFVGRLKSGFTEIDGNWPLIKMKDRVFCQYLNHEAIGKPINQGVLRNGRLEKVVAVLAAVK
jgi:hypothetical protein